MSASAAHLCNRRVVRSDQALERGELSHHRGGLPASALLCLWLLVRRRLLFLGPSLRAVSTAGTFRRCRSLVAAALLLAVRDGSTAFRLQRARRTVPAVSVPRAPAVRQWIGQLRRAPCLILALLCRPRFLLLTLRRDLSHPLPQRIHAVKTVHAIHRGHPAALCCFWCRLLSTRTLVKQLGRAPCRRHGHPAIPTTQAARLRLRLRLRLRRPHRLPRWLRLWLRLQCGECLGKGRGRRTVWPLRLQ